MKDWLILDKFQLPTDAWMSRAIWQEIQCKGMPSHESMQMAMTMADFTVGMLPDWLADCSVL